MSDIIDTSDHSKPNRKYTEDENLVDTEFGHLIAIAAWPYLSKSGNRLLCCECVCGATKLVTIPHLRQKTNPTISCGCRNPSELRKTHGLSGTREHSSWRSMISRCYHPTNSSYKFYGGVGIIVCEEWRYSFENFLNDMGTRPIDFTLERKDSTDNYNLANCVWANKETQANNKSNNHLISFNGQTKTLAQWSKLSGINAKTLQARINNYGFTVKDALTKDCDSDFLKEYVNEQETAVNNT